MWVTWSWRALPRTRPLLHEFGTEESRLLSVQEYSFDYIKSPMECPRVPLPEIKIPRETPLMLDTDRWLFRPIGEWGNRLGRRLSRLHTGLPHGYLLWQLLGAAILLAVVWLLR